VLARCEAMPTEKDKAAFGAKNLEQDLGRLLRDATIEQHRNVLDRPLAKSALAGETLACGSSESCTARPRHCSAWRPCCEALSTVSPWIRRGRCTSSKGPETPKEQFIASLLVLCRK
jgi:hypothetical protein